MSEIKLKPCPFCGGKAVIHTGEGVCVICRECHSRTMSLVDGMSQGKPDGGAVYRVIELRFSGGTECETYTFIAF